jgi:hypothetical protein
MKNGTWRLNGMSILKSVWIKTNDYRTRSCCFCFVFVGLRLLNEAVG